MVVSLYVFVEALTAVYCLHCLYGEKLKFDFATIGIVLAEVTWMQLIYFNDWNYNLSWFIYPFIALYCGIRFGFDVKAIFINNFLWIILISVLQAGIMLFASVGLGITVIGAQESLVINIIIFLILKVLLRKLNVEEWSKVLQRNEKVIVISIAVIIVTLFYVFVNYRTAKGTSIVYYIMLLVSLILIGVSVVDIGKHKVRAKEMEAELRLHKLYEESFKNLIDDIRARQHEFDNHINTIYSQHYLCHTYEELVEAQKRYCQNIVQDNSYNKLLSKGNPIILGFLYSKFTEAEKMGVNVEYKIKIGDMKSEVPIHKIIELLGNLITNAIEALIRQKDMNKLKVVMVEQPYEIAIDISNECKGINQETIQNFFRKGYSEKGENRGYGLYNVRKICEEYDVVLETAVKMEEASERLHFTLIINKSL